MNGGSGGKGGARVCLFQLAQRPDCPMTSHERTRRYISLVVVVVVVVVSSSSSSKHLFVAAKAGWVRGFVVAARQTNKNKKIKK